MANIFGKSVSGWFLIKIFFLFVAAAYFVSCAADREGYHFFDSVDLAIHEAGHLFFLPFGEFLQFAGGTILQLLVPLIFVLYFLTRKELYSMAIVSFWLGQSFVNVARYAGDAVKMELPLLGGGEHDWAYLLAQTDMLGHTEQISAAFYYAGVAIIVFGIIIGVLSFNNENADKNKNY